MPGVLIPNVAASVLASSSFRGEWEDATLLWSDNFDSGLDTDIWSGTAVSTSIAGPSGGRPGYTSALHGMPPGNASYSFALDLAAVGALAGKAVSKIKFWDAAGTTRFGSPPYSVSDGAITRLSTTLNTMSSWTQRDLVLAGLDVVTWTWRSQGGGEYGEVWVAGVEVYGPTDPYLLSQFVIHSGRVWKSLADHNSSEPGMDANWSEVSVNASGVYATADRPDAADSGIGATIFDSDLGQPLWSDGAGWVDATGTSA